MRGLKRNIQIILQSRNVDEKSGGKEETSGGKKNFVVTAMGRAKALHRGVKEIAGRCERKSGSQRNAE